MPHSLPQSIECTPAQEAALARVRFAFEVPAGIVLLCGPAGTGTTLVLSALARLLDGDADGGKRRYQLWSVPGVVARLRDGGPLPDILVVDDAHLAGAEELAEVAGALVTGSGDAAACGGRPRCVVLAGRGRLLTLIARDSRIAARVRLRAIVPPFTADDTRRFLFGRLPGPAGHGPDEPVVRTIHEITAGIPANLVRLVDLTAATAGRARPLTVDDIETIHRRLDPQAV